MPKIIDQLKNTVDATIPDKEELTHGAYPRIEYLLLVLRNLFVVAAVVLFVISFFAKEYNNIMKAVAYFAGAAAYLFECLAITDCFQEKVPHTEMFMVYCFGPLYLLMGLSYIL